MEELSKLNYINVGPKGTFQSSGNHEFDTVPKDVDNIFEEMEKKGTRKILLYFHGGLVRGAAGMATATYVTKTLAPLTDTQLISFVWETGLFETVKQNLDTIYKTDFFRKILEKVIKVAGDKLGIDVKTITGIRGVSTLTYPEINAELNKEAPFEDCKVNIATRSANVISSNDRFLMDEIEVSVEEEIQDDAALNRSLIEMMSDQEFGMLDRSKVVNVPQPGSRGILSLAKLIKSAVKVVYNVIKRHVNKRDHGFYPTIIEEILRELYVADIGVFLWGAMKTKAEVMWESNGKVEDPLDQHAGDYFLSKLQEFTKDKEVSIDLIGHSAGAIVICHLVKELLSRKLNVKIRNTIFMAPACRSDLFFNNMIPNMNKIGAFRMFTMEEKLEIKDRCIPLIYTRSLLYMISGILEKDEYDAAILGMQRYLLPNHPYDVDDMLNKIAEDLKGIPNSTIYSLTKDDAPPGQRCVADHHGNFYTKNALTMDSILEILKP